jgi:hypothetical protein
VIWLLPKCGVRGGGVKVSVKKHMTKKEQMRALHERSVQLVEQQMKFDTSEPVNDLPAHMKPALAAAVAHMKNIREGFESHVPCEKFGGYLKKSMHSMSDESLKTILNIMAPKKRTEEKLIQLAYLASPCMHELDDLGAHVEHTKKLVLATYVEIYCEEYAEDKRGVFAYNNEKYIEDVKSVLHFRTLLQGMVSSGAVASSAASAAIPDASDDQKSGCTVA